MPSRAILLVVLALNPPVAVLAQVVASASGHDAPKSNERATEERVPEGLTAYEWSSIRDAYEAGRYRVIATEGGYSARNPGQRWTTTFDGRGFRVSPDAGEWSFGLALTAYGWAENHQRVALPAVLRALGGRLVYDWDACLSEWYINEQRGLEHGFTVHSRPEDARGSLTLSLDIRGDLLPKISSDGCDVAFVDAMGSAVLSYAGLKVFDASGKALSAGWQVRDGSLLLTVDDRSASYPVTIDPVVQQAYLKASNTDALDFFGFSVSVFSDTVVVGASRESTNATEPFYYDASEWASGLLGSTVIRREGDRSHFQNAPFVAAGGTHTLSINGAPSSAGFSYAVVGTASGTVPGFVFGPYMIPLNIDADFDFTLASPNTPPLLQFVGTLNSAGDATASITLPPGTTPLLIGLTVHHVVVALDPLGLSISSPFHSAPVALTFVP